MVRLLRDHPHTVLMAEALGRHRIHRGSWGHPEPDPVDVRTPLAATGRALRLLHTLDPHAQLRVHADDTRVYWRTDRIRVSAISTSGAYPNVEKIREDILAGTTSTLTLDRAELLATLTTADKLAAANTRQRLHVQPAATGGLDVVLRNESGAPAYTTHLPVAQPARTVPPPLILNPTYARQAVAFLDGDHVHVHTTAGQLPIYLAGQRRHAIVLQIAA